MAKEATTKPAQVFRRGSLSVSVFANETTRDGKPSIFHKVTISKSYKKDDESYGRTSSFGVRDFATISHLLYQAEDFIRSEERTPEEETPEK